jgi:hypothetical protein
MDGLPHRWLTRAILRREAVPDGGGFRSSLAHRQQGTGRIELRALSTPGMERFRVLLESGQRIAGFDTLEGDPPPPPSARRDSLYHNSTRIILPTAPAPRRLPFRSQAAAAASSFRDVSPLCWTRVHVAQWLESLGLRHLLDAFGRANLDGRRLLALLLPRLAHVRSNRAASWFGGGDSRCTHRGRAGHRAPTHWRSSCRPGRRLSCSSSTSTTCASSVRRAQRKGAVLREC